MFMVQYLCWSELEVLWVLPGSFTFQFSEFQQQIDLYLKQECYVLTLAALWYKTNNNVLCGNQNVICVKYRSLDRSKNCVCS